MLVRITKREDPDHTVFFQRQSDLGLCCMPSPFWLANSVQNLEHLPYSIEF